MATEASDVRVRNTQHTERVAFEDLRMPGAYICNETGHLFRIPEDGLVSGRSPLIEIVASNPTMLTRLSNDPWVPISKARQLAADADLYIDF
jgi:hypothetical protein